MFQLLTVLKVSMTFMLLTLKIWDIKLGVHTAIRNWYSESAYSTALHY